ncbi:hypothetical protein ACLOAV_005405 [Pseudogymnoascus australis]
MGYFEAWAPSKRSRYSMLPEDIPFGQYTHIIFSFATINPSTFKVTAGDSQTEYLMSRIGAIKVLQPDIKIWVALGGWAFNDPGPTQTTFSDIASSTENINIFLDSLVQMMNKYGFDGVDIDWEYPVADDRHGRPEDYENIVTFMTKLHTRMKDSKRGTSMALPASFWYLQNFDIKALESQVDWFNIMSYDMHGSWDIDNEWLGPWANSHTNMTDIQLALDLLWRNDISPSKVTMGMAFYSRSFTLTDPACSDPGCRVSSGGNAGEYSDTVGVLLHPEIQNIITENDLTPVLHSAATVKTVSWGNQWVSFDDVATWRLKANIARGQCIEGFMVWAMSQDDEKGTNIRGLNQALGRKTPDFPDFTPVEKPVVAQPALAPELCRWSGCFKGCPSGFKAVPRDGHDEVMMDTTPCNRDLLGDNGYSVFCCPSSGTLPTCTWRGHKNSGNCQPGCEFGEVEVGSLDLGCKKNYQSACCTSNDHTEAYGKCLWTGCLDDPKAACGGNFSKFIVQSVAAWGGHPYCRDGQSRGLCCPDPPPGAFNTECKWVPKLGYLKGPGLENICEGQCPEDSVQLSMQVGFNLVPGRETACYGTNVFCCSDPAYIVPRDDDWEDSFSSMQGKEFKLLVGKYMDNPSCPATILEPPIHGQYGKRNLAVEAQEYKILQGRATDCTLDNWTKLLTYAVLLFTQLDSGFDALRSIWDTDFAGHFDENLEVENLVDYFYDYPWIDRRGHLEYVLLNPLNAGQGMRTARRAGTELCHIVTPVNKRGLTKRSQVVKQMKRVVWPGNSDSSDVPNVDTILGGILNGELSLHYARWQYQSGAQSDSPAGPFLELAYWIGPNPGVVETANSYNAYRDMTYRTSQQGAQDQELLTRPTVFHLHVDPNSAYLNEVGGHTYLGVPGFRIYHGQEVRPEDGYGQWRVENRDTGGLNARHGWTCPDAGAVRLQTWAEGLWAEGYVSTYGLRLIIEPPTGDLGGEINPENPGYLVRPPNGYTTAAGNRNPYMLNFLLENGYYNFFTQPPPPNLKK